MALQGKGAAVVSPLAETELPDEEISIPFNNNSSGAPSSGDTNHERRISIDSEAHTPSTDIVDLAVLGEAEVLADWRLGFHASHSRQHSFSSFDDSPANHTSTLCSLQARSCRTTLKKTITETSSQQSFDVFLSHLQRNGQDAVITLQMFLQQARPNLKSFLDVNVDMHSDLTGTIREGVLSCRAFIFFITDGVLQSEWCAQEIRWALEYEKNIVLVRETDSRHGGVDMKDFLRQVPDDLLPVFRNTIAIPWYREPAFRSVSIESILKACDLEDTFSEDLSKLSDIRQGLLSVFRRNPNSANCLNIIEQSSLPMRIVFYLGGFSQFRSNFWNTLYVLVFGISFWACGLMCAANCFYRSMPAHNFVTDASTAYVHLPAWHSWYMWRRFVHSPSCAELVARVMDDESQAKTVKRVCQVCGWIILAIQSVMVLDVLGGYALPATLHWSRHDSMKGIDTGHLDQDGNDFFSYLHALAMWVVIPPVVSSMFASYSMFSFITLLHYLDARTLESRILECMSMVGGFFNVNGRPAAYKIRTETIHDFIGNHMDVVSKRSTEEITHYTSMQRELHDSVVDVLHLLFRDVQGRIDATCEDLGSLWVHLVMFSVIQIVAITASLRSHLVEGTLEEYHWWWVLQDLFHLVGGIVLLALSMGIFSTVTVYLRKLGRRVGPLAANAGCPSSMQTSMATAVPKDELGMHVLGASVYIDAPQVLLFGFIIFLSVVDTIVFFANYTR